MSAVPVVNSASPQKWIVCTRLSLEIFGNLQSKANSRKLVTFGGKPRFIKSDKAREWWDMALMQIPQDHRIGMTGPIRMTATIWYQSARSDLDPSLLMDVLQAANVYTNDRNIVEQHLFKAIDKQNPRVHVIIEELCESPVKSKAVLDHVAL